MTTARSWPTPRAASSTPYARLLSEFRPTPACGQEHHQNYFVEEPTFTGADALLSMLREPCPNPVDGRLPVRVRNLAHRLVPLRRPDEPALLREAARSPWLHGPDRDDIVAEPTKRAEELEAR